MTGMGGVSAHQFLTIYIWFGLIALVFLMALIARFYERLSSKRTYYQLFTIPVIVWTGATVRLAGLDRLTTDTWANVFLLIGGASLAALCLYVYHLMTSGR
jgi:uncharacterized SAM-binding protein YcdF (DUF218 family)